jgi:hypothetical protein
MSRLRRQPFERFRIHLSDGTAYEIRHPEVILVGRSTFTMAVGASGEPQLPYERTDTVSLLHITRLERAGASAEG